MSEADHHDRKVVVVTAAIVERGGAFLVTRRVDGAHLAGYWEFPGGKCEPNETLPACLEREIREELDARISVGEEIFTVSHSYPERDVELHFFACDLLTEPRPLLGQVMKWVPRGELKSLAFPPADEALIARLTAGRA